MLKEIAMKKILLITVVTSLIGVTGCSNKTIAEDKAKNICWNCDHHSDDEIRECKECGRVGKSNYVVLNKKR